jgi:hypothetical protein
MRLQTKSSPIFILLMGLLACGDDATTQPSLTATEALDALEQARLEQVCAAAFDCGEAGYKPDLIALWPRAYKDKAECLASARVKASSAVSVAQLRKDVEEGLKVVDGVAAKRCIDALAAPDTACQHLIQSPEACRGFFAGARTQGQACRYSDDCVDGQKCDDTGYCQGQCIPRTCGAQTCTGDTECITDAQGARTCAPRAKAMESCEELRCDATSSCLDTYKSPGEEGYVPPVCVTHSSLADGELCSDDRQCGAQSTCAQPGNICTRTVLLAAGAACKPGERPGCVAGLVCGEGKFDAISGMLKGKCVAPVGAGKPCYQNEECGADLRCVGVSLGMAGACSSLRAKGEECFDDDECASGLCNVDPDTYDMSCQDPGSAPLFSCPLMAASMM